MFSWRVLSLKDECYESVPEFWPSVKFPDVGKIFLFVLFFPVFFQENQDNQKKTLFDNNTSALSNFTHPLFSYLHPTLT